MRTLAISLLSLTIAVTCHAGDAVGIFARARAASGGASWDGVRSWHSAGTVATGGLSGNFDSTIDLRTELRIDGIAGDLYTGNKGSFANPDLTGNLGGGVLRRFDVGFDYAKKIMYLAPNADWVGKADAFDRSGLWLLGDGDAFKIVDVAADSAALKAGMHLNDRIVSIGGEAINKHSLAEWRERLRTTPAGTHLAIRFQRDGKEQTADLVLADRIAATVSP